MLSLRSQGIASTSDAHHPGIYQLHSTRRLCHVPASLSSTGPRRREWQIYADQGAGSSSTAMHSALQIEDDHRESTLVETLLRGTELVLIVWAAAPHVLSLVARMRSVTEQLSNDVQDGTQRPPKVCALLASPCMLLRGWTSCAQHRGFQQHSLACQPSCMVHAGGVAADKRAAGAADAHTCGWQLRVCAAGGCAHQLGPALPPHRQAREADCSLAKRHPCVPSPGLHSSCRDCRLFKDWDRSIERRAVVAARVNHASVRHKRSI